MHIILSNNTDYFIFQIVPKVLRNDDGAFRCPCCPSQKYKLPDSLKRHLKKHIEDQEAQVDFENDSDAEVDNDCNVAFILNIQMTTPLPTSQETFEEIHSTRENGTAVLSIAVLSLSDVLYEPSED